MTLPDLLLSRGRVDRLGHLRTDAAWLASTWSDPATRAFAVSDGRALVRLDADAARLVLSPTATAPEGERYLLGRGEDGVTYFAVGSDELPAAGDGVAALGLREVGVLLDALEVGLFVEAAALQNWHRTHTHCPRCGAPTVPECAGHVRRCPVDDSQHFPRTDPAVIMSVVDDEDRLLLGRQAVWPPGRYSTLAGFVEPGESLEAAVAREVFEESGVEVVEARYLGSQPWPFPASLMLGFTARAKTTAITTDDDEIEEARWVTRAELAAEVAAGTLRLPPPVSIARRLIEHWYGAPVQDDGGAWR